MDEENELCRYGTPLDPIEEDQVPSKKPIAKEDQIAVDANGRRRFHGAFTGGFSAGFWNTVGSQEGWKPQTFKSSRKDKAGKVTQSVEDFMDSEDTGEFGIAPKRIQAQEDFASGSSGGQKRKYTVAFETTNLENVLQKLMMPSRDNIGTRLLRKMGWREGQGVGVRLTKRAKKQAERQHRKEQQLARRYGCDLGPSEKSEEESSSDDSGAEVTFAPDDFDTFTISPKDNTFGLGYSGLDRSLVHQKPGKSEAFAIVGKNNRKMMISGKGFGLGALEDDDDEDIYSRDDMTQYDFSLDDQKTPKNRGKVQGIEMGTLEGFVAAADPTTGKFSCKIFRIDLPRDFQPRHFLQRKSRFAPLPPEIEKHLKESFKSDKHALSDSKPESSRQGAPQEYPPKIQEPQKPQRNYKLFLNDLEKQERFDKFLEISEKSSEAEIKVFFQANQPLNLSQYAREMEQREFLQARKMHKPLAGLMSDRFVSENTLKSTEEEPEKPSQEKPEEVLGQTEGPDNTGFYSKRVKVMWKPDSLLCKRFNVPEPFGGMMTGKEEKTKHRKSSNIFECLRDPISQRIDFTASKIQESPKEIPQIVERVEPAKVQTEIPPDKPKIPPELPPPGRPERLEPKETKEVPPPIKRPKNELEMAVLEAKDKHPADKKDLFRAIFEDSEESEDEKEEEPQEKAPVKEDINPLRNPSEPQGIFSKIFFVRKAAEKKKEELEKNAQDARETEKIQESPKDEDDPEIFGPKLPPPTFQNPAKVIPARNLPETLGIGDRRGEKWVEKNEVDRKKKKKEKHSKEKKHKKRKKKHKSRD